MTLSREALARALDQTPCEECGHPAFEHHNDGRSNAVNQPCHYLTDRRTHFVRCECKNLKEGKK